MNSKHIHRRLHSYDPEYEQLEELRGSALLILMSLTGSFILLGVSIWWLIKEVMVWIG